VAEHPGEQSIEDCLERLGAYSVGRVVCCANGGPQKYLVNFAVDNGSIVFRTSAHGPLATQVHHNEVAFEVDELDHEHHHGWSVIAHGHGQTLDADETHDLTSLHMLAPGWT
jgi:nitroimidazol reductase NimA-like FMN-containing flavoprotein (pyridoxamine 5'-phosphate oxidase superfamily)